MDDFYDVTIGDTEEFDVCVKTIDGESDFIPVTKVMKIEEFKKKYIELKKPSKCAQLLFSYKGRNLQFDKTFEDLDIGPDDTIHVLIRMTGC